MTHFEHIEVFVDHSFYVAFLTQYLCDLKVEGIGAGDFARLIVHFQRTVVFIDFRESLS